MSEINDSSPEARPGLSRRTVVRTAANAAWMVPAISLVTEAPALAASGDTIAFGATSGSWSGLLGVVLPTLSLSIPINLGTKHSSSAVGLTVTITFPTLRRNITPNAPSGWTVSPTGSGAGPFTFTKSANVAAPATVTFAPTFSDTLITLTGYATPPNETLGLTTSANSTVTSPPPATFTSTGQVGGLTTVSGSLTLSN